MQITASTVKLTVAGRICVSFPAGCCTKQDKLEDERWKKDYCVMFHIWSNWRDVREIFWH